MTTWKKGGGGNAGARSNYRTQLLGLESITRLDGRIAFHALRLRTRLFIPFFFLLLFFAIVLAGWFGLVQFGLGNWRFCGFCSLGYGLAHGHWVWAG